MRTGLIALAITIVCNTTMAVLFLGAEDLKCFMPLASYVRSEKGSSVDKRDSWKPEIPRPPFPASDQYKQFERLLGLGENSHIAMDMYHEMFLLTKLGDIILPSNNFRSDRVMFVTELEDLLVLADNGRRLTHEEWANEYPDLHQWKDAICAEYPPPSINDSTWRYTTLESMFHVFLDDNGKRYTYARDVLEDAIKRNFPKDNHTRYLLLTHGINEDRDLVATNAFMWSKSAYTHAERLTDEHVKALRLPLIAYSLDISKFLRKSQT